MGILDWLGPVGDVIGAIGGSNSARDANRTNIKLQREQQAWEKEMSNTAVQRRAADIEAAGGNRALAFVNGQEASTPSVTAAHVEPTFKPEWTKGSVIQALTTKAQLDNLRANTAKTIADARIVNVEADIREQGKKQELAARINALVEKYDQDDLTTKIMREQWTSSAAEARRLRGTVDSVIQTAKQQARAGQIDLNALENVAKVGGLEASKAKDLIQLLIYLARDAK